MAGGIDGASDAHDSSVRSERIQRMIDSADASLSLLASLDASAPSMASGTTSFGDSPMETHELNLEEDDIWMHDDQSAVDVSVQKGLLHVKGVFPDQSVEYVDIDPRFTTIGELKRAFCRQRNTEVDLGFPAQDASMMFDGQLVEDDWLVVDCGMGIDGVLHIVPTPGRTFALSKQPKADPKLPISSIAATYAIESHRPRSKANGLSMVKAHQFSRSVRPEETEFANMVSDFYQHIDRVQDVDAFCERLLRGYIDVLQTRLERLEETHVLHQKSRTMLQNTALKRLSSEIQELRHERNTWRLLFELRRICRSNTKQPEDDGACVDQEDLSFDMLEDDAIRLLELRNENYRIQQAVKAWLESMAVEDTISISQKRGSTTGRTLKALKNQLFGHDANVQMDPDAVFRQGDDVMVDDDCEDEAELLKAIWKFVRAGRVQDAVDLCVRVGESWRAASLSGGNPVGASELSDRQSKERLERWGNPLRAAWKAMCWKFSEQSIAGSSKATSIRARTYEQLVYAAMSGNVRVLTQSPLCETWEDHCWAYLHAMVEHQQDEMLFKLLQVKSQSSQLIVGYNPHHLRLFSSLLDSARPLKRYQVDLDTLFEEFKDSKSEVVRTQAQEPHRHIQAKLVTARIEYIVSEILENLLFAAEDAVYGWNLRLEETIQADHVAPQFLRFAAHLLLFASATGESFDTKTSHMILKLYIRHLIQHGQLQLVPIYAAQLPDDGMIEIFTQTLCLVHDRMERDVLLKRMVEFTSMAIVSQAIERTVDRLLSNPAAQGHQRMRAIEFCCFYNEHRASALYFANRLARQLAVDNKVEAIKTFLEAHVPDDCMGIVHMHRTVQSLDASVIDSTIRQHLSWKAYVAAMNQFALWRNCVSTASMWSHYSEEKDFVTELMYHVSRSVASLLDVLHFDNGWFCGSDEEEEEQEELRRICLPPLVTQLHFVQVESARVLLQLRSYPDDAKFQLALPLLRQSMQVADVVADDQYQVYAVMSPTQCDALLKQVEQSAIALLYVESCMTNNPMHP